ncbi:MAG: hypothetical protein KGS72_21535 [Cyanobacteria bacterium REEB67]|nr:hypothetical protein [Cyanobacteria bacterium REEB67]
MSHIDPIPQVANALLAYSALKNIATRPGAKVTITPPHAVEFQSDGRSFHSTSASRNLEEALIETYKLWQEAMANQAQTSFS